MKVLLFNGSPRANGFTFTALSEIAKTLNAENMAWILKCIEAGIKSGISAPKAETSARTNFIR